MHSHHDNSNANGIVIDSGAEVVVGGNLQCSVRTLGQGPLGVVSDDNEIWSGQIAAPCTFRHEGRRADLRCRCDDTTWDDVSRHLQVVLTQLTLPSWLCQRWVACTSSIDCFKLSKAIFLPSRKQIRLSNCSTFWTDLRIRIRADFWFILSIRRSR